jgi:hypothetical protein
MRAGADVKVFGLTTEKQVAHTPAYQISGVTVLVQPVEHLQGVGIDVPPRNPVLLARDDDWQGHEPRL